MNTGANCNCDDDDIGNINDVVIVMMIMALHNAGIVIFRQNPNLDPILMKNYYKDCPLSPPSKPKRNVFATHGIPIKAYLSDHFFCSFYNNHLSADVKESIIKAVEGGDRNCESFEPADVQERLWRWWACR